MAFCIHKDVLGSDLHLSFREGEFSWIRSVPDTYWLLGLSESHPRSIEALCNATGVEISTMPSDSHANMWSVLRPSGVAGVPIIYSLGSTSLNKHLKQLVRKIDDLLSKYGSSYYANEFVTIRQFLQGFKRCGIDKGEVIKILNDDSQRNGSMGTFIPLDDGLLSAPIYNQTSSCSGRLTIKSGPSILTMRKDRRHLLRPACLGRSIVQIDFISLEPRVALSIANREAEADVYEYIRREVLNCEVTRDVAKIATISALYGMSARRMSETIKESDLSLTKKILQTIRRYFKIPDLERDLTKQVRLEGSISSVYGRVMKIDDESKHILVNRFIQSTAADAALLGFSSMIDQMKDEKIDACPIFVIHDALLVDINNDDIDRLRKFILKSISLPGLLGNFPVSIEIISSQ